MRRGTHRWTIGRQLLVHIYSQAARQSGSSPRDLGGLTPTKVLAVGESQSASRSSPTSMPSSLRRTCTTGSSYTVDATRALRCRVHLRRRRRPAPAGRPDDVPSPTRSATTSTFRARVPNQTDVYNGNVTARQPDTKTYRLWEVAGTSHYDTYGLSIGMTTRRRQGRHNSSRRCNTEQQRDQGRHRVRPADQHGPAHWVLTRRCTRSTGGSPRCRTADRTSSRNHDDLTRRLCARRHRNARGVSHATSRCAHRHDRWVDELGAPPLDGSVCCSVPPCRSPRSNSCALHESRHFVAKWTQSISRAVKAGFILAPEPKTSRTPRALDDRATEHRLRG